MWGVPKSLNGFFPGDDAQDPDLFALVGLAIGPTADLLWNNQGSTGPVTPNHYTAKIVELFVANNSLSSQATIVKISVVNATSTTYPVAEVGVAAQANFHSATDQFRLDAPPGFKFQASSAFTADIIALAKYVKGAGQ